MLKYGHQQCQVLSLESRILELIRKEKTVLMAHTAKTISFCYYSYYAENAMKEGKKEGRKKGRKKSLLEEKF